MSFTINQPDYSNTQIIAAAIKEAMLPFEPKDICIWFDAFPVGASDEVLIKIKIHNIPNVRFTHAVSMIDLTAMYDPRLLLHEIGEKAAKTFKPYRKTSESNSRLRSE